MFHKVWFLSCQIISLIRTGLLQNYFTFQQNIYQPEKGKKKRTHDKNHTLWKEQCILILRIIHIILKRFYTLTESLNCLQSDTQRTRCCVYTVDPLMMSTIWLETCRGIWKDIINKCIRLETRNQICQSICYGTILSSKWTVCFIANFTSVFRYQFSLI